MNKLLVVLCVTLIANVASSSADVFVKVSPEEFQRAAYLYKDGAKVEYKGRNNSNEYLYLLSKDGIFYQTKSLQPLNTNAIKGDRVLLGNGQETPLDY